MGGFFHIDNLSVGQPAPILMNTLSGHVGAGSRVRDA